MNQRDHTIDIVRGIAIFTMIAANMAASNFAEPHPFWFRVYGSFAAPTFILLSGFMVPFNARKAEYGFGYFLIRGLLVVFMGVCIDTLLWQLMPFTSFDVLYVIGFSLPVSYLLSRLNVWLHLTIALTFIFLAPVFQYMYGYSELPAEVSLAETQRFELWMQSPVARNFLIEGWFPVFPWMGVALLGSFAGRIRITNDIEKGNRIYLFAGLVLFVSGILLWNLLSPQLITREGYSELFYPPGLAYLFTFLGFIFCLIALLQPISNKAFLKLFAVYGRSSLLMYILHTVIIIFVLQDAFPSRPLSSFLLIYLFHAFFLWWIAKFVQLLKEYYPNMPFVLRFIVGG